MDQRLVPQASATLTLTCFVLHPCFSFFGPICYTPLFSVHHSHCIIAMYHRNVSLQCIAAMYRCNVSLQCIAAMYRCNVPPTYIPPTGSRWRGSSIERRISRLLTPRSSLHTKTKSPNTQIPFSPNMPHSHSTLPLFPYVSPVSFPSTPEQVSYTHSPQYASLPTFPLY